MRVCYFGTYRAGYSRNQIMIEGLRCNGIDVVECQESLWTGVEDRVRVASGGAFRPAFWLRVLRVYMRLLRRYRRVGEYDVLVVGYPGQADVFVARLLAWWRRRPLVWDIFMSIYLIGVERGLTGKSSITMRLIRRMEWLAARLPDRLILDTPQYVEWFTATHGVSRERFRLVPTGADDRYFKPLPERTGDGNGLLVIYYGTFIPNHGVEYIVEAAHLLQDEDTLRFEMIGRGPDKEQAVALARRYGLRNITFVDWLEKSTLLQHVGQADICLGAFGTTPQSLMTVQNKIYEGLAMRKTVLTGDSPAVRDALAEGEDIYLCRRADPADLARGIRVLAADPALRCRLADHGFRTFTSHYDLQRNGLRFANHLTEVITRD